MKFNILFIFICMSLTDIALAQCSFTVNAGPDKLVCKPGDAVTLDGRITGNPNSFFWEPTVNLNNPRILTPRATVFGPMTYYLVARGLDPTNLVFNGNFSAGNTGFFTDYILGSIPCYGFGYLDCEGTYDVITNPQLGHTAWANCGDHTTGSGMMMVVNGAASFQNVWCQQISVMPDMDYQFRAWCASVEPSSPAILQITVNGSAVGAVFNSSGATCSWEEFGADFNSGANTTLEICITNLNTNTGGNDFALDDISLRKICETRDTVEVDVINIVAEIAQPEEVTCDRYIFQLDATGSSAGPGWTYQWTASPGKILSGDKTLTPTIDGPGTYNLTVCSPLPGCCKTVTVEVTGNKTPPNISLSTKDTIGCGKDFALIRTASNSQNLNYTWTGPNGFTSDEKDPLVNEGGVYVVTVTDEYNCIRVDSIRILEKAENPKVSFDFNHINCKSDSARLKATSSIQNSAFEWFGPGGTSQTGDQWTTADSGWYLLKTTTPSGCVRFDSIRILKDLRPPSITFKLDSMDCARDSATLRITSRQSDTLDLLGPSGFVQLDSVTYRFGKPGIYIWNLKSSNLCEETVLFEVVADTSKPDIFAVADTITCLNRQATLIGSSSDPLANYTWIDPAGNNFNQNVIRTSRAGLHRLIVQSNNACQDSLDLMVQSDTLAPQIAVFPDTINCRTTSFFLRHDGDTSSLNYTWMGPGGYNSNSFAPLISKGGIYRLELVAPNFCKAQLDFEVIEDLLPPVLNGSNEILTCSADSIQLKPSITAHNGVLVWSGPGNYRSAASDPFVKTPGIYTLVAENANGCSDTLSVEVFADQDKPDLTVVPDTIDCLRSSVTLVATSTQDSLSYRWTGPSGVLDLDSDLIVTSGGTYRIRVENQRNCFTELDVFVPQDTARPYFSLTGDSLNCQRTAVSLGFQSQAALPSPSWIGPGGFSSSDRTPTINRGGWYRLTLLAPNHCSFTDSLFVIQDTLTPDLSVTGDTINCRKPSIDLLAITQTTSSRIEWLRPDGSASTGSLIKTSVGGKYRATVIAPNYCTRSLDLDIAVDTLRPSLRVANGVITCDRPNVVLDASSQSARDVFQWTGPGGFTSNQPSPNVNLPGSYLLRVTGSNGCQTNAQLVISADTIRPSVWAIADSISCIRKEATVQVTGDIAGKEISWFDQSGTPLSSSAQIKVNMGGMYRVSVRNPLNGCLTARDVRVIEDTGIIRDINMQTISPKCGEDKGSAVILDLVGGHGGYRYSIDNGLSYTNSPSFSNLPPGQYQLRVVDQAGCDFTKPFEIIKLPEVMTDLAPEISLELGASQQLLLDINIDLSKIQSIDWQPRIGLSCYDCQNPLASPLETTDYTVRVVDENGCESISYIRVAVRTPDLWVPNVFSPNGDVLNDLVWVHGPERDVFVVRKFLIFDRWGNQVFANSDFKPNDPAQGWDGSFKGENCLPGVYVYWLEAQSLNGIIIQLEGDITLIR